MPIRIDFTILVLTLALSALSGCGGKQASPGSNGLRQFGYEVAVLDTRFHIAFFAADPRAATAAFTVVATRLADLDSKLSMSRVDGELARLCSGAGGPPRKLSDDLFAVLEMGGRVATMSGGAFDVTAAPYGSLWQRAADAGSTPAEEQIAAVRPLVGWAKLRLDPIERTASLEVPGMRLDPGPLGLGYAADQVLEELRKLGVDAARIDAGSVAAGRVIRVGAAPPGKSGWPVEVIEPPRRKRSRRGVGPSLPVFANVGIGSSPHRLVDPLSGILQTPQFRVAVQARTGAAAAALACAAAVLGPETAESLTRNAGARAAWDPPRGATPASPRR